jgi:hypothetical protein
MKSKRGLVAFAVSTFVSCAPFSAEKDGASVADSSVRPDSSVSGDGADGSTHAIDGGPKSGDAAVNDVAAMTGDASAMADDVAPMPDDAGTQVDSGSVDDTPIVMPDTAGCPEGQGLCPQTPFNNEPTSNYTCQALVGALCPAPDLMVFGALLVDDGDGHHIQITVQNFADGDSEIAEGCVFGTGMRRLLRFNFAAVNVGTQNMNVGRPDERDSVHWEFFVPHGHFHVKGWGDYRLRAISTGTEVGYGHKQSFCLEDNIRTSDMSGPRQFPPPLCSNFDATAPLESRPEFGLSVGWGDEYPGNVRCQWIDLGPADSSTAGFVPDGFNDLAVSVNMSRDGSHLYRENNYGNNTTRVRVQITGNNVDACVDTAGDACAGGHVRCDGSCG